MDLNAIGATVFTSVQNAKTDVYSVVSPILADVTIADSYDGTNGSAMWETFGNTIVNIFDGIRPFVIALVTVAIIVEAIGCIIGGEQSRERFKHALPWVIGAAILIMIALTVAGGIVDSVATNSDWTS